MVNVVGVLCVVVLTFPQPISSNRTAISLCHVIGLIRMNLASIGGLRVCFIGVVWSMGPRNICNDSNCQSSKVIGMATSSIKKEFHTSMILVDSHFNENHEFL